MIELELRRLVVSNPTWSATPANPGDKLTLAVHAPYITASEWIEFRILHGVELVDVVRSKRGKTSAEWVAPNVEDTTALVFRALLRDSPKAENGHLSVLADAISPVLNLRGTKVAITLIDECFVPKQEQLSVTYTVTDAGGGARAGRYEIWGERYPGATPEPLYTEAFIPSAGASTWNTWSGKANHGELSGHFITPEFSPYRLRIIVGPDSAAVKDAYGKGMGKVGVTERNFEVRINAVEIRLMDGLKEGASKDEFKIESALKIEPRQVNGDFADDCRLPSRAKGGNLEERGRIRIPMTRHSGISDDLGSGGVNVGDAYMGDGTTKFEHDLPFYSRPELPIEFEPRLKSRDPAINADDTRRGLFEPEAVGPLQIQPIGVDTFDAGLYAGAPRGTYLKNAAFKVKRGLHDRPFHNANNRPEMGHWLARMVVANDDDRDFDVATADPDYFYTLGSEELVVHLNWGLLQPSKLVDDSELDNEKFDYREVTPVGPNPATQIRFRAGLTKAGDVVWIARKDDTLPADEEIVRWGKFPPGPNCHQHLGGERTLEPTAELSNRFRAKFSAKPLKPAQAIIGRSSSGTFPFTKHVMLRPAPLADMKDQEVVLVEALDTGKRKALAGAIFSPSVVAGDSYRLHACVAHEAYARSFGFVDRKPAVDDQSGVIDVWRLMAVDKSLRLPDVGSNGMAVGVGSLGELALGGGVPGGYPAGTLQRSYRGDGINMLFTGPLGINTMLEQSYCEWTIGEGAGADPGGDALGVHRNVDLKKYRKAHNEATKTFVGRVKLDHNDKVKNWSCVWDFYREDLPPGLVTLVNLASNVIAAQPRGTRSQDVGNAVRQAILLHGANPDVALNAGVAAIPPSPLTQDQYESWVDSAWDQIQWALLDKIVGKKNPAKKMNILRWPRLHEESAWIGYTEGTDTVETSGSETNGFCRGDGQAFFKSWAVTETFPHEMGHSMNLVHFVAGNFEWKHHDVNSPDCLMSYAHSKASLYPSNVGAIVGPTGVGARDQGWPDAKPGGVAPDDFRIFFKRLRDAPAVPRGQPCAKCALKARGWKDNLLPFAWRHPDVY